MRSTTTLTAAVLATAFFVSSLSASDRSKDRLPYDFDPAARYAFGGVLKPRIEANTDNWLIRAPASNPGLVGMFSIRDRRPKPNLVPWAGEFVGKYLISAVQALRMSDDPELKAVVKAVVDGVIESQAEDGYLGPFPKEERLLKHWDLWGHYHIMLGLLMWHEQTGDERAKGTAERIGDLACKTYLTNNRRVLDAGSDEMNLSIIHGLGRLHRLTGKKEYLQLMRKIESEWPEAGDYFNQGLAGVPFYRTPRPRWESLHGVQGLVELYQITGDQRYAKAFLNLWESIHQWDVRNTGGFSSGEQADGNPYANSAIETCCTIAWMATSVDALRLGGTPQVVDDLELATFNGMLGAQHPSGNWWTYNTPMNGVREASDDTIVFQSRAGTPELNCCSVNAPRGLGMLTEWAVMRGEKDNALVVNYLGSMTVKLKLRDGTPVCLVQKGNYPLGQAVVTRIALADPKEFPLRIHIPGWANEREVRVTVNGKAVPKAIAGGYLSLVRQWKDDDVVAVSIPMDLRYVPGDMDQSGRMSVYRGPLLLAYDVAWNDFDEDLLPALSPEDLKRATVRFPERDEKAELLGRYTPWLFVEIPFSDKEGQKRTLRLCDFATAGCIGSHYVSWLPGKNLRPSKPRILEPRQKAVLPPGPMAVRWSCGGTGQNRKFTIRLERSASEFTKETAEHSMIIPESVTDKLRPNREYAIHVEAEDSCGKSASVVRFRIDSNRPRRTLADLRAYGEADNGDIVVAPLAGNCKPTYGKLASATDASPAPGPNGKANGAVAFSGKPNSMAIYSIKRFPEERYTVAFRFRYQKKENRMAQLFSAWCKGMDDPLRICIIDGKLSARVETGQFHKMPGIPIPPDKWTHVAAVKEETRLTLYVDGKSVGQMKLPRAVISGSTHVALGGNPKYRGQNECLDCSITDFRFSANAMSEQEVKALPEK